jgi:hypothetical protein
MDGSRFDSIARLLDAPGSRRVALTTLLGGTLGLFTLTEGGAKKKKKGKRGNGKKTGGRQDGRQGGTAALTCPGGYSNCGEQCVDLRDNPGHCGACGTVCSPGKVCCGGVCANLQADDTNCGTCGRQCLTRDEQTTRIDAAEICSNGACVECSIAGSLRPDSPRTCCSGLKFCPGPADGSGPNRCIPANQTC